MNKTSFSLRTLCDTNGVGKINNEQFALAMYLVQQKLKGVDPPATLTPEMIPPSMRPKGSTDTTQFGVTVSHLLFYIRQGFVPFICDNYEREEREREKCGFLINCVFSFSNHISPVLYQSMCPFCSVITSLSELISLVCYRME